MSSLWTWGSLAVIAIVFILFMIEVLKINKANKLLTSILGKENKLDACKSTPIETLCDNYAKSINIPTSDGNKSNIPASEYFNEINVTKMHNLNLRMLDTAAGTLVGLGLLGTFLGLTVGVMYFDSSNTANINKSIESLLSGMGTAFSTSLLGMILSMIFTLFDKSWRNKMQKLLFAFTESVDAEYYIDDHSVQNIKQQEVMDKMYAKLREDMQEHISSILTELDAKFSYTNEEGEKKQIGNAVREILTESTEQTKALKSFSTDLAIELNNGFDEALSRQMQQKILPLMENVDNTTRAIVDHIDQMAQQVASPATDMIQNVVDELKRSMSSIIQEFNHSLSGSTTNELENLAKHLGTATQAFADLPRNMENISATLQLTLENVKSAVSDISNTSANANSAAMQQMQEQISFATGAISNAISEVREVMSGITQSSQEQSNQMVSKMADAAEKMSQFLSGTVSTLSTSVQSSIKNITDDMNSKQADLIALQEDTTTQTRNLLDSFNVGLDRLRKLNDEIAVTMNSFGQAQGQIAGSTAHLQTITDDMKQATQLFNKSQTDYSMRIEQLQTNSQRSIDGVTNLLHETGMVSKEYVDQFNVIRQGLSSIFSQLQNGLTEYSTTVQATTQKYLEQYTTSLTNTTDALSSTIQQQNEVVEMLVESLNSKKN